LTSSTLSSGETMISSAALSIRRPTFPSFPAADRFVRRSPPACYHYDNDRKQRCCQWQGLLVPLFTELPRARLLGNRASGAEVLLNSEEF
jgi:hypothetical protein